MTRKIYEIDYQLLSPTGEVVDTSVGGEPLVFLEGAGQVVKGLEMALQGREAGEALEVTIPPELGYGRQRAELIDVVHRSQFPEIDEIRVGMTFQTQSGQDRRVVRVIDVQGDQVTVDANHPLAGISLNFKLQVRVVRDASDEEIRLGYPLS